jgi:uncharacterized protein with GYD domain
MDMPKFLIEAHYDSEGVRGVVDQGGSARREAVTELFAANGGTLEAFYFSFGPVDVYVIGELPDNETAAAIALTINADGRTEVSTTVLLTPEQIDAAAQKSIDYRAPGE